MSEIVEIEELIKETTQLISKAQANLKKIVEVSNVGGYFTVREKAYTSLKRISSIIGDLFDMEMSLRANKEKPKTLFDY